MACYKISSSGKVSATISIVLLLSMKNHMLCFIIQQGRLMPHLAAAYAMKIFSIKFLDIYVKFSNKLVGGNSSLMSAIEMELHVLSSATKPLCAWTSCTAIQDCRESCGGHGYLKGE